MIDRNEQGKGYGQAALQEIIRYFRALGADRILLSTEPENECGLHVYHKAGFRETGCIDCGEAVLRLWLLKKTKKEQNRFLWYGVDVKKRLRIREKNGYGVSIAIAHENELETYCACCGKYEHPENADFCVDEVIMKDEKLYAKFLGEDGEFISQLYPIGKNTFGHKGGFVKLTFGKDCVMYDNLTFKKITSLTFSDSFEPNRCPAAIWFKRSCE